MMAYPVSIVITKYKELPKPQVGAPGGIALLDARSIKNGALVKQMIAERLTQSTTCPVSDKKSAGRGSNHRKTEAAAAINPSSSS